MGRCKHGKSGTRVHNLWLGIIARCQDDCDENYGARGIKVCERWLDFNLFFEDMGYPPTNEHSIDRIDVNGNYQPDNCRWATRIEQARNTRRNTFLNHNGKSATIAEWSEITGIKAPTICKRIYDYGWSVDKALTTEPQKKLPGIKPWIVDGMSRSSWYRARTVAI